MSLVYQRARNGKEATESEELEGEEDWRRRMEPQMDRMADNPTFKPARRDAVNQPAHEKDVELRKRPGE